MDGPPLSFLQLELRRKDKLTASELFFSVQHIYKDWDYRCLVPYSDKNPNKWKTYDMHNYRKAFSEERLKRVDQYKYDNNFFNWNDPKVMKYFTKSTNSLKKAWKKTYGFPYIRPKTWGGKYMSPQNSTKCFEKCARYVSSNDNIILSFIQFSRSSPVLPKIVEREVDFSVLWPILVP